MILLEIMNINWFDVLISVIGALCAILLTIIAGYAKGILKRLEEIDTRQRAIDKKQTQQDKDIEFLQREVETIKQLVITS
jgi:hypothetical protein